MTSVIEQYFRHKKNAGTVCKVGKYLMENNITDEDLDKNDVLTNILEAIGKKATSNQLIKLREAIRIIDIDVLKTKPWHINSGVLFIAGVEYVLFSTEYDDDPEGRMYIIKEVYSGNEPRMNKAIKALFIGSRKLNQDEIRSAQSFFKVKKHTNEDDENLELIRDYLNNIKISEEESEYIKEGLRNICPIRSNNLG